MKLKFLMVLSLVFTGCASSKYTVSLQPTNDKSYFILDKVTRSGITKTIRGNDFQHVLKKGTYVSFLKNEEGVFYLGANKCVFMMSDNKKMDRFEFEGGLWVPSNNVNAKPRVFTYIKPVKNSEPHYGLIGGGAAVGGSLGMGMMMMGSMGMSQSEKITIDEDAEFSEPIRIQQGEVKKVPCTDD